MGQLITRKRVDLLLQAFSQLDLPTARLRIIGKGNKPATIPLVPRTARTIDLVVGERHLRVLGDLHQRRKRTQAPQRQHVETVPRHFVQKLAPEIKAPHLRDVVLRRIRRVAVTGRAQVERDVELDAATGDVGGDVAVRDIGQWAATNNVVASRGEG